MSNVSMLIEDIIDLIQHIIHRENSCGVKYKKLNYYNGHECHLVCFVFFFVFFK